MSLNIEEKKCIDLLDWCIVFIFVLNNLFDLIIKLTLKEKVYTKTNSEQFFSFYTSNFKLKRNSCYSNLIQMLE